MTEKLRTGLADLAAQAMPTDLHDRVHSGAHRIAQRNRAFAVLAATVLAAGFVAGYATLRPIGAGPGPTDPASPTGSPSPSATAPLVDLRNATFWVPTYPGPWGTPCFGGSRTFVQGIADVAEEAKLHMIHEPVRGDLDGKPGDEVVVKLVCSTEGSSDGNPLLLRVEPDGHITTMGWVNLDADGELLVLDRAEPIVIADGGVSVVVIGRYSDVRRDLDKQTRIFAYQDGRLYQVGGPTTFAPGTTDVRAVDLRNSTLYISTEAAKGSGASYLGYVKTVGGTGTAYFEKIVDGSHVGNVAVTVAVAADAVCPRRRSGGGGGDDRHHAN